MKPTTSLIHRNFALSSRLRGRHRNRALATAFMTALASAATPLSQAAQLTWSGGGGDANWSTGTNWAGTAPVNDDALIFAGNTNLITNNDITGLTVLVGTTPASALAFTNASNVTGGAFTLGGNAITLGGPINTTAMTAGTLVETISLQLDLIATRTITTATNHGLTISGLVNDTSGTNSAGITKTGVATLLLSNDLNNFTSLAIQQGTLSATSIEPSGIVSAIGIGNTITMGNTSVEGILTFTGTVAPTGNINRAIALANSTIGGRINNNSATVPLVFNGTFSAAGASNRAMTLGGTNTGANDFQNILINPTGGVLTVAKTDGGTWTLSGANTYTGQTNINNGTLNAATIADSVSSNLGLGTLIRLGNTNTTGTLNYTGSGTTTSRTITIGNNSGTPAGTDTGGSTTGLSGSVATSRTLTLGGANTGANEIQGIIANGLTGTMATNVAKSGIGTWLLSGANTYTGTTTINAGTLKLGGSTVLPTNSLTIGASGAATASTLDLNGFSETIGSLTLGRPTTTVAGATANVANNGGGSPVLTLGGALTYNAGSATFENGQATISANIDTAGVGRNIIVGDGSGAVDLSISGAISGVGNLTKSGAGVLQLSGANINTGNLIIQESTVKLGASNVLTDTTSINVGNNASVAGATFDLNGFSDTVTSVTLGTTAPGTAGLTHSVVNTGGTGVLTLGATLTYNAGGANLNGQATISADLATGATARSFAVGDGSATDDLVITGALQAGGGFNVNGSGTLRLDNAGNNHASSVISGGATLKLGANSVLGTGVVNLDQAIAGTSTLDLNGKTDAVGGALSLSNSGTTALGAVNQIIDSAGGGVLQLNGAVSYSAGGVGFNNGTSTISASLELNGVTRNFNIDDSDQVSQDVIISGVIQNSTGTAGIGKNNAGTLVLSGANTYNGNTGVNAGTLELADNASLKFVLGATSGVNNSIGGAGTAILNGDFVIDTSAADALPSGSWSLENVTSLTGAYGSTFTISGFSDIGSDQWEKNIGGGKKYTFNETTGILTLGTSGSPYTSWATSKGLTGLPGSATDPAQDADPDKDGRNNIGEFAFNGDPLSGADNGKVFVLTADSDFDGNTDKELILTVAVRTGTPAFTGSPSPASVNPTDAITYSIEGSLNLAGFPTTVDVVPTAVTTGLPAAGAGYEYRSFSLNGSNGLSGKGFLRAKVTSP
jgi:fibronectin-binding autotransporter adhesin